MVQWTWEHTCDGAEIACGTCVSEKCLSWRAHTRVTLCECTQLCLRMSTDAMVVVVVVVVRAYGCPSRAGTVHTRHTSLSVVSPS